MPKKNKAGGGGFGGGIGGLNQDYERYQTGADLDFDSDVWRNIEDRYGRVIGKQFDRTRADALDRFDSAIMPSSIQALREGEIEEAYGNAYTDALTQAALGIRQQNMGLTSDFAGAEASNLGSKRGLAGAKASAAAARYGADRSAAVGMAGINAQRERDAWNSMMDIANLEYADEMQQWDYGSNFDQRALDDFLRQSGQVGSLGGEYQQPYVPSTNPYLQLGNTAMGVGAMMLGGR